jgi:hypothetical protein
MPGFIASQIARINRDFILVALALALVATAIGWFGWTYVSAVVLGPRMVSACAGAHIEPSGQAPIKRIELRIGREE